MKNKINDNLFFGHSSGAFINSFSHELQLGKLLYGNRFDQYKDEINEHSYRSDSFKKEHNGLHVLFAGCSVTFGDGLLKEELWSWAVYEELKKQQDVSGYFNLALPGSSIAANIIRLFKYFSEFGNPDVLFFNMPDIDRFLSVGFNNGRGGIDVGDSLLSHQTGLKKTDPGYKDVSEESIFFGQALTFELYGMLQSYCIESGIRLISFSWTKPRPNVFESSVRVTHTVLDNFETFYNIGEYYEYARYAHKYIENNLKGVDMEENKIPLLIARDKDHPGVIQNKFFADTALKILDGSKYRWIEE